MTRGLSTMTIPAGGGDTQVGSSAGGASGFILFGLGGKMGSFGISWFSAPQWGGG